MAVSVGHLYSKLSGVRALIKGNYAVIIYRCREMNTILGFNLQRNDSELYANISIRSGYATWFLASQCNFIVYLLLIMVIIIKGNDL